MDHSFIETGEVESFTPPEVAGEPAKIHLPPGKEVESIVELHELTGSLWDEFKVGDKVLFVWGRIDFTDEFNEPRWVTFFRHQVGTSNSLGLLYCAEGNQTSESADAEDAK